MKKSFKLFVPALALAAFLPSIAFAQGVGDVLVTIISLLNTVITVLIILAVVYFIWGVISFVIAKGGEDKTKASGMIKNGLIGLFLIVAFWGIIGIVQNTFGLDNSNQIQQGDVPCVPVPGVIC